MYVTVYAIYIDMYIVHLSALLSTSVSQMMHQNPDCGRLGVNGTDVLVKLGTSGRVLVRAKRMCCPRPLGSLNPVWATHVFWE